MQSKTQAALISAIIASACPALADPPAGYYNSVTGTTGPTIKNQLTSILNNAIFRTYGDARDILQITDEDQDNPANIILVYNGASIVSTWTSGATWNREHCWPRSLGVGSSGSDNSDLHMLRPSNPGINSLRGNLAFGAANGRWDPDRYGVNYRGEMARVAFYANTRYTYLNMAAIGTQSELVDWHIDQMPDADDARRNDSVFTFQENRNPFVDRPEWVWAIYGDAPSDAQIILADASPTAGATNVTIDLGRFIGDGPPIETSIDLVKTGSAPTTYLITSSGDAITSLDTGFQAGFARGNQSLNIPVTLPGQPGNIDGSILIDTTEITSAGSGVGGNDGDDLVTFIGTSLTPAIASFEEGSSTSQTSLDLGNVAINQTSAAVDVTIWNLASASTGANLEIDSIVVSGADNLFSITGDENNEIAAGSNAALSVSVTPDTLGPISATATITVSDEDVPGETSSQLTLMINANVVDTCLADVNADGSLNGLDFGAWLGAFNAGLPSADQNQDGQVNGLDFGAWLAGFNAGCD